MLKGVSNMNMKGLAISMGLGVAAGAVAVMMLPRSNSVRRLAVQAADKVENTAWKVSDKLNQKFDL